MMKIRKMNIVVSSRYSTVVLLICFVMFGLDTRAQTAYQDSLLTVIKTHSQTDSTYALALALYGWTLRSTDIDSCMWYTHRSLSTFKRIGDKKGEAFNYHSLCDLHTRPGGLDSARFYGLRMIQLYRELGDLANVERGYTKLAYAYGFDQFDDRTSYSRRMEKKLAYTDSSIALLRELGDTSHLVTRLSRRAEFYANTDEMDKAGIDIREALDLYESSGDQDNWQLYVMSANYYSRSNKKDTAIILLEQAKDITRKSKQNAGLSYTYYRLGGNYYDLGNVGLAHSMVDSGLAIAYEHELQKETVDGLSLRYNIFREEGKYKEALEALVEKNDFLQRSKEREQDLAEAQFKEQVQRDKEKDQLIILKKDQELSQERIRRQGIVIAATAFVLLLLVLLAWSIFKGRKRADKLLHNILPEEVAKELKERGEAEAKLFEETTVLFTDFKGFTTISEMLSPADLVEEINTCFKAFDGVMEKYGIEKIKTIGDAYMAAGGLHVPRTSEPQDVVNAGLEMQAFMKVRKIERDGQGLPAFEMRVGIHTGPVVAGIVGVKKFQYDIWGDTVNTASRMESSGEVGKVNISEATYELVKDNSEFGFISRGKVEAKGKGEMEMYFVNEIGK